MSEPVLQVWKTGYTHDSIAYHLMDIQVSQKDTDGRSSLIPRKYVERSTCGLQVIMLGRQEWSQQKRSNAK